MEKLIIAATDSTPRVEFDPERDYFAITGKSTTFLAIEFYNVIWRWFEDNASEVKNKHFHLHLPYFNTVSSKMIIQFIQKIKLLEGANHIEWHCESDDEDLIEFAEELIVLYGNIIKIRLDDINKE